MGWGGEEERVGFREVCNWVWGGRLKWWWVDTIECVNENEVENITVSENPKSIKTLSYELIRFAQTTNRGIRIRYGI